MKKILIILLALAICFSGCWNVEIVDPREETVQLESGEGEKENGLLSEEEIGQYLEALNQIEKTRFFAKTNVEAEFVPLYKEKSEELYWDKTPDLLVPEEDYDPEKYSGYYTNEMLDSCYEINNFKNEQEIADYMSQWVSPEIFYGDTFKNHILEFEDKAYLLRFSRGYGIVAYENAEIISESDERIVVEAIVNSVVPTENETNSTPKETINFVLEKTTDEKWIVVSLEKNNYSTP
ncbi:MAG: hypothetical protein J6J15_07250 [Oscillospiraceae bacterium]|nr:hypothetical protein [Oscillospiraceae bacterium]